MRYLLYLLKLWKIDDQLEDLGVVYLYLIMLVLLLIMVTPKPSFCQFRFTGPDQQVDSLIPKIHFSKLTS